MAPTQHIAPTWGTKGETLQQLAGKLHSATVLPAYVFTVAQWRTEPSLIMNQVAQQFGTGNVVVRSSSTAEDTQTHSQAGAFASVLDVTPTAEALSPAIDTVIDSYDEKITESTDPQQVLIQPMLANVAVSGVITTCTLTDGAPYYVINYDDESGRTDTITGGIGVNKTVLIHHHCQPTMLDSPRVAKWWAMAQELYALFGDTPLDIEFAHTHSDALVVLQVRPITVQHHWHPHVAESIARQYPYIQQFFARQSHRRGNLLGSHTVLTEMSDWNPAEMIGTTPRPLAASLYRTLITDSIWRKSRASLGYRHPDGEALMVMIAGKPYIDVRNSFNSFLPANLPDRIGETLITEWLDQLCNHPEWHDKIEFNIAQTAVDCTTRATIEARYQHHLSPHDRDQYYQTLSQLTHQLILGGSLATALQDIATLTKLQQADPWHADASQTANPDTLLYTLRRWISQCRQFGTFPFAVIARHAFVAESMLRSLVAVGALNEERLTAFRQSLHTITRTMSTGLTVATRGDKHQQEEFLAVYGHLRPGTYDILSPRYDQRTDELFGQPDTITPHESITIPTFRFTHDESQRVQQALHKAELSVDTDTLLNYCRMAITERENAKFIFTRTVSNSLELLAQWGQHYGLSRNDVSFIHISPLLNTLNHPLLTNPSETYQTLAQQGQQELAVTRSLQLSHIIRHVGDLYVTPLQRGKPNFVTRKAITATPILLTNRQPCRESLTGRIVCIENADPGFDWIFTHPIAGLVTMYGGSNSHMTIRCAEFAIPAAIGCGQQTFQRLIKANTITINAGDELISGNGLSQRASAQNMSKQ